MRILTKMSCSHSDNRLIFPDNASPHAMKDATGEGHWLTASTFIFPPFHLIIIFWSSSYKMYSCGREYIYTWIGVYVYTYIQLKSSYHDE